MWPHMEPRLLDEARTSFWEIVRFDFLEWKTCNVSDVTARVWVCGLSCNPFYCGQVFEHNTHSHTHTHTHARITAQLLFERLECCPLCSLKDLFPLRRHSRMPISITHSAGGTQRLKHEIVGQKCSLFHLQTLPTSESGAKLLARSAG